ncbi:uncharacterized protein LY89DRAFT_686323 [Mollisia scopiformis]|uniref:Uncharacterized protein n=1 Tax=Mollisia scopiformis TaxID=149040 RepID=A0A194X379_MOLSC|nr:uncharacterized protein LY89DRAFT_686323 [Mollisia scopiformis]KUJ14636.1 hypothetical protein LY89DRAFT_686323 [Mollisia scopiformis]
MGIAGSAASVVGHGAEYAATYVALDAGGSVLEYQEGKHHHNKANEKLNAQYENFRLQYDHEQAAAQSGQIPLAGYQPGLQIPGSIQSPQSAAPVSPSAANVPGPPSLSFAQNYGNVPLPASCNTTQQQSVVQQQQATLFAGGALQFNTHQITSNQQTNPNTQQATPFQHQYVASATQQQEYVSGYTQQSATSTTQQQAFVSNYPPEKPPISSYPSPYSTPLPVYSPPVKTSVETTPSPFQHRPSLPTPTITPHAPMHRPSLPPGPPPGSVPLPPVPLVPANHELPTPVSPIHEMSTSTGRTTPSGNDSMLSMEEQLALRMKVLQMELAKRGEHVEVEDEEDDEEEEKPKPPEIPETFPTAAFAPEPPRKTQDAKVESAKLEPDLGHPVQTPIDSSPKLNVFVDLQQPTPLNLAKPSQHQPPTPQTTLPYPTFSTPQPEKQQQRPPPPVSAPPAPAPASVPVKTGLSITGGISISYNRDTTPSQTPPSSQDYHQAAAIPVAQYQQSPQQQPATYQTYNLHQRASSIPMNPQQQAPHQHQEAEISYTPNPPQANTGYQTYNPAQQTSSAPAVQQQQAAPLTSKPPHPLQHQDSGYGSRHSSTFSVSTVASMNIDHSQHVVSPPTPSYASLNQQSNVPQQTQYGNTRQSSYGQMPMTYTPSPMSPPPPQQYFPPPPPPPPSFGHNNQSRVPTPNPQFQNYQPGPPAPNYGNAQNGQNFRPPPPPAAQGGNYAQGWQWENPNAGASGEPNYGPPPPIPSQWRGS